MYFPLNIWLTLLMLALLLVWQWYDKRYFKEQYPFFALSGLHPAQQGFMAAGLFSTVTFLIASLMGGFSWVPNREAFSFWETPVEIAVNAVLEELIFRGLVLTLLWRFMQPFWAITLHCILFAVYHWFLLDLFWDVPMMARFFAYAFAWGIILGFAYTKTGSLWTPIGIHLGWNLMEGWVFGDSAVNVFNAQYPDNVEPLSGIKSVIAYNVAFLTYFIIFFTSRIIKPSKMPRRVVKTEWLP